MDDYKPKMCEKARRGAKQKIYININHFYQFLIAHSGPNSLKSRNAINLISLSLFY